MHTARQLHRALFGVRLNGEAVGLDDAFPAWTASDRFGIVIDEPLGALGASLLIQAATTQFFDAGAGRRDENPQYPEIYAFHLERSHGELSPFDFWPPRKEVIVAPGDDLVAVLNDRAITRLAVPSRVQPLRESPMFWADVSALRERMAQTFLYSPTGRTEQGDLELTALSAALEYNADRATDLEARLRSNAALSDEARLKLTPGPATAQEVVAGRAAIESRRGDVGREAIARSRVAREALRTNGLSSESYRRVDLTEALRRIGVDEAAGIA